MPATSSGSPSFSSLNIPILTTTPSTTIQPSVSTPEAMRSNLSQPPIPKEPIIRTVFQNFVPVQTQMKLEAERRAQVELEKAVNEATEIHMEGLLYSAVHEGTVELAAAEMKAAEEQYRAEQQKLAEQQLKAQEELRKRIVEAQVERISTESLSNLLDEVVLQLISELAQNVQSEEQELLVQIDLFSEECLDNIMCVVIEDECHKAVSGELKRAKEFARLVINFCRLAYKFYF